MSATLLPFPRAVFYDANGNPLAAGFVWTYVPNTTTPKTSWQDAGESIPNTNPIYLDANGSCLLYGQGQYTLVVIDALGNQVPAYSGLTNDTSGASQFNVKAFGATGNGTTDDTAAFQAWLDALAANGGGQGFIPPGQYKLTSAMTYTAGFLYILGAGKDSVLNWDNPTDVMMTFSGSDMTLSDFKVFTPYQSCTAGGVFVFNNPNNAKISRIWVDGGFNVITFSGSPSALFYRTSITDCNFVNAMCNGITYSQYHGGEAFISDTEMLGAGSINSGNGIIALAGDTFCLTNMNIASFKVGIEFSSQTGGIGYVANVFATNILCDGNGQGISAGFLDGWIIDGSAATTNTARVYLTNCWAGSMGRNGFNIINATDIRLVNCIAIDNGVGGFVATGHGTNSVSFHRCTATANSLITPGAASGILIDNGIDDFQISDCKCGTTPFQAGENSQQYGIIVVGPDNAAYIIANNSVYGNLVGSILDSGTGAKVVANNLT